MAEDKFIIRPKRSYGENTVVSCRMPVELVKRLDSIGGKTGRTRNELILKCVEFALDKLEIAEDKNILLKSIIAKVTYLKTEKAIKKDSDPTNFKLHIYPKIHKFT